MNISGKTLKTAEEGDCFRIEFADHGKPFDPLVKDHRPLEEIPLEEREPGGYGIFLVKKNFKLAEYKYEEMFGQMANHLSLLLDKK